MKFETETRMVRFIKYEGFLNRNVFDPQLAPRLSGETFLPPFTRN